MPGYALRLIRDDLPARAPGRALPALNRVLYVLAGELTIAVGETTTRVAEHTAAFAAGSIAAAAGPCGATALRYELAGDGTPRDTTGVLLLEHPIELATGADYLMRCDR